MTSRMRRAVALLALTGALTVIGVTAGPGLAQGPSPAQLAEQGWVCVKPPPAWIGMRCYNPGEGHPPLPSFGEAGRASYTAMDWAPSGEFLGHVHMIRADLYAGQPCQSGGPYVLNLLGYYQCFRYL